MFSSISRIPRRVLCAGAALAVVAPSGLALAASDPDTSPREVGSTITGTNGSPAPARSKPVTLANGQSGVLSENTPADFNPGQPRKGDTGKRKAKGKIRMGNGHSRPSKSRSVTLPNGQPGVLSENTPEDFKPGEPREGDTITKTPGQRVGAQAGS